MSRTDRKRAADAPKGFRTKLSDRKESVREGAAIVRVFLDENEAKPILNSLIEGGMRAVIAHCCPEASPSMRDKIRERLVDESTLPTRLAQLRTKKE